MTTDTLTALHAFLRDRMERDEKTVRNFAAMLTADMDGGVGGTRTLRAVPDLYEATIRRHICREMLTWHPLSPADVRAEILSNLLVAARVHPSSTSWASNTSETYERLMWADMHRAFEPVGPMGQWGRHE